MTTLGAACFDFSGEARLRRKPAEPQRGMQLFRYSTSIYGGSDVLLGASWSLLPWFVAAGAAFILVHAVVKALADRRRAGEPR
jgi:hypothetical protein